MFCEKEFIFIGECTPRWFHCGYSHLQVGNPETDYYYDYKGLLEYAWSHAVISDQQYDKAKQLCDFKQFEWSNECNKAMNEVFQDYSKIDIVEWTNIYKFHKQVSDYLYAQYKLSTNLKLLWERKHLSPWFFMSIYLIS